MSSHLTVGEVASILGEPEWKVRRIVDALEEDIPRAGLYRLIPRSLLTTIAEQLDAAEAGQQSQEGAS